MGSLQKSFKCPFTWDIDENLVKRFDEESELLIEFEEQPVLALLQALSSAYFLSVQKNEKNAVKRAKRSCEILSLLDKCIVEKDDISYDVLVHVTKATVYNVYLLDGNVAEVLKLSKELADSKKFDSDTEIGTLYGCQSIVWSFFHEMGCDQTISLAEMALSKSPSCSLWHYILGRSLRHLRKTKNGQYRPSEKEITHFLRCYELSPINFYAIRVAEMHRENRNVIKCTEMFGNIYRSDPKNASINLRLALFFTTIRKFDEAEKCLNRASSHDPKNPMLIHYKGLFYRKQKKLKEASHYFKAAAQNGNYVADLDYADIMQKLDNKFDYIGHLRSMSQRYELQKQQIFLDMAMQFYKVKNNLKESLKHFLLAIERDPTNELLKNYKNITINWREYLNIFDLVHELLLKYKFRYSNQRTSPEMEQVLTTLRNLCDENRTIHNDSIVVALQKVTL